MYLKTSFAYNTIETQGVMPWILLLKKFSLWNVTGFRFSIRPECRRARPENETKD